MFGELTKAEAQQEYSSLKEARYRPVLSKFDKKIRERLYPIFNVESKRIDSSSKHELDLVFGLELYTILNEEFDFNLRLASNDDVWIYLSMRVIPDIVFNRWSDNEARFYKTSNRIWLKSIWWYVHIGYKNNKEETYLILKNNSTDTIVQLLERTGSLGFNVDLYKEILHQLSNRNDENHTVDNNDFRKVMKNHTFYFQTIVPEFFPGGIVGYVDMLFEDNV